MVSNEPSDDKFQEDMNLMRDFYSINEDGDKIDLQEMLHMIEVTFQKKFKTKWEQKIEEQKLKHPTW